MYCVLTGVMLPEAPAAESNSDDSGDEKEHGDGDGCKHGQPQQQSLGGARDVTSYNARKDLVNARLEQLLGPRVVIDGISPPAGTHMRPRATDQSTACIHSVAVHT
jgi:hypothetical protein